MEKYIRFLSLILAFIMILQFSSCKNDGAGENKNSTTANDMLKGYDVPKYSVKSVSKMLISHGNIGMSYFADKDSKLLY